MAAIASFFVLVCFAAVADTEMIAAVGVAVACRCGYYYCTCLAHLLSRLPLLLVLYRCRVFVVVRATGVPGSLHHYHLHGQHVVLSHGYLQAGGAAGHSCKCGPPLIRKFCSIDVPALI